MLILITSSFLWWCDDERSWFQKFQLQTIISLFRYSFVCLRINKVCVCRCACACLYIDIIFQQNTGTVDVQCTYILWIIDMNKIIFHFSKLFNYIIFQRLSRQMKKIKRCSLYFVTMGHGIPSTKLSMYTYLDGDSSLLNWWMTQWKIYSECLENTLGYVSRPKKVGEEKQ